MTGRVGCGKVFLGLIAERSRAICVSWCCGNVWNVFWDGISIATCSQILDSYRPSILDMADLGSHNPSSLQTMVMTSMILTSVEWLTQISAVVGNPAETQGNHLQRHTVPVSPGVSR